MASALIGLFMEAEHSAIYKPAPELKGAVFELEMQQRRRAVYDALKAFDEEFEALVSHASPGRLMGSNS